MLYSRNGFVLTYSNDEKCIFRMINEENETQNNH